MYSERPLFLVAHRLRDNADVGISREYPRVWRVGFHTQGRRIGVLAPRGPDLACLPGHVKETTDTTYRS